MDIKIKRIYIIGVLIILISALLLSGCGFFAIALEEKLSKISLDNPYVNDNFNGWKKTELGENITILLPDEWILSNCDTYLQLLDKNGEIVAYAASFGNKNPAFQSWSEFFSDIYGKNVYEVESTLPGGVTTGGDASYCEITLSTDTADRIFCLMLYDNTNGVTAGKGTLMVFPADNGIPYENQLDIIAAIAFSHQFPN